MISQKSVLNLNMIICSGIQIKNKLTNLNTTNTQHKMPYKHFKEAKSTQSKKSKLLERLRLKKEFNNYKMILHLANIGNEKIWRPAKKLNIATPYHKKKQMREFQAKLKAKAAGKTAPKVEKQPKVADAPKKLTYEEIKAKYWSKIVEEEEKALKNDADKYNLKELIKHVKYTKPIFEKLIVIEEKVNKVIENVDKIELTKIPQDIIDF